MNGILRDEIKKPIHQRIDELIELNKSKGYELGKDYCIVVNPKIKHVVGVPTQ